MSTVSKIYIKSKVYLHILQVTEQARSSIEARMKEAQEQQKKLEEKLAEAERQKQSLEEQKRSAVVALEEQVC